MGFGGGGGLGALSSAFPTGRRQQQAPLEAGGEVRVEKGGRAGGGRGGAETARDCGQCGCDAGERMRVRGRVAEPLKVGIKTKKQQ